MTTKKLSVGEGIVYAIGSIIGSGILFLPSLTYKKSGNDVLVVWILATILCIPLIQLFYEMISKYQNNSMEEYFKEAFGEKISSFLPFLIFFTVILGMSASAIIVGGFFAKFFNLPFLKIATAYYLIFFGLITNLKGISFGAKVQYIMTSLLFIICILIFGLTFPEASQNYSSLVPSYNITPISQGILVAFWAFAGFENLSFLAPKFENPKKDFLTCLLVALVFCGAFYLALTANYSSLVAMEDVKTELGLYQLAEKITHYKFGVLIVTIFSLFAVKINFNSWVAGVSSLISENNYFLGTTYFSVKNESGTPIRAVSVLSLCFFIISTLYYLNPLLMNYALEMVSANFIFIYILCIISFLKITKGPIKKAIALTTMLVFIISMINTGLTAIYPIFILLMFIGFKVFMKKRFV
ncbi:hypothetical protein A9Q84_03060 [Halobacteriovorax marinus]|uniref:Amino acid permease n=1 Tax=Halobacteriovorax marinus TaxID=97084 RepID=A0A1Y5FD70_9BACT|nr:hypothetical protein A9Q84_03060 [Halobacteriovorax marinus]